MIEQPLWHDDFYFHSCCRSGWRQRSVWTNRFATGAMRLLRSIWSPAELSISMLGRVGGFSEAIAVHNATQERGIPVWCGGMLETGIGRAHNIALSTLRNSRCPAMFPPRHATGGKISLSRRLKYRERERFASRRPRDAGYEVRTDLIERLTVRKEEIRAMEMVA